MIDELFQSATEPRRVPATAVAGKNSNPEIRQDMCLTNFSSQPANVRTANAVSALPQAASYFEEVRSTDEIFLR
jgi:hypothetical protein